MPSVPLAVLLTLAAASLLSLSLIVQRFALSYPARRMPVLCVQLPRDLVWFGGLILYGGANGLKVVALQYGPLSVLASVFTTVLIFNVLLARLLLGEQLTLPKVAGAVVILVGAALASIGSCTDCPTQLSAAEVEELVLAAPPGGALYLSLLVSLTLGGAVAICSHESRCPLRACDAADAAEEPTDADRAAPLVAASEDGGKTPPRWTVAAMALVYAGSLGLDEALADLLIKAWTGILALCGDDGTCGRPILWVSVALWVASAFASAFWWYRKVLARYETTQALPIEYGALNAASACTGLLFYDERLHLSAWQLDCTVGGVFVILVGIGVGLIDAERAPGCTCTRQRAETAEAARVVSET